MVNQPIIFQQINTWMLESENEVNLQIKNYIPCVNDWIGVFNVYSNYSLTENILILNFFFLGKLY